MNQSNLRQVGFWFVLLVVLELIGCSTSSSNKSTGTTPQITVFSATPATVNAGQTTTLNWVTTNAASIAISPAVPQTNGPLLVTGSAVVPITATTTFTLTATSSSGATATQTLTVTVTAGPIVPQITPFSANPTAVNGGQTTTITWATTNAASITISPAVPKSDDTGPLPTSGSAVAPVTATTTFTLTATSSDGTAVNQTLTVTVPFTLSLTTSNTTLTPNQIAVLSWQITGGTATALSIDNSVCSPCTPVQQGSATVSPAATTTYTATATASDGTAITASA